MEIEYYVSQNNSLMLYFLLLSCPVCQSSCSIMVEIMNHLGYCLNVSGFFFCQSLVFSSAVCCISAQTALSGVLGDISLDLTKLSPFIYFFIYLF